MKLLLVEDEMDLSSALSRLLSKQKHTIDIANDGLEAINYIECNEYDLILLDVMMPNMNGFEVLKKIRNDKNTTPVIMLTAKGEIDDKVSCLDSGADDYITKPFEIKELISRIAAVARRNSVSSTNILNFGNIELDTTNFKISNGNTDIILNNKEFQILHLLMKNPKNIIASDIIFEKVWGLDSDSDNNVIWVNMSYIRKKLEKLDANFKIILKRNLGYGLELV